MRVVVTGGRRYADRGVVYDALDEIHAGRWVGLLAHGACVYGGADILAEEWAKDREVPYMGVPAKWKTGTHGRGEGMIRNGHMLDLVRPDLVVAFPGGNGTADCIKQAKQRNIEVKEYE